MKIFEISNHKKASIEISNVKNLPG